MLKHWIAFISFLLLCGVTPSLGQNKPAPLKVLLITGGGYHKYEEQIPYVTEQIAKRANVQFDVAWGPKNSQEAPPILSAPNFGEGYDAIVYDLCYAADSADIDPAKYANAIEAAEKGKPSVFIHCAMHVFRRVPKQDWPKFIGMRTNHHEPYGPFSVKPADPLDPITKGWPADWKTLGDEQYVTEETYPGTKKLLISTGVREKERHPENVVAWQHMQGQGRVFGTTLGHDMKTIMDPHYEQLLANGLLWACDKLQDNGEPRLGYQGPGVLKAHTIEEKK
jgi:uncharacterized protein